MSLLPSFRVVALDALVRPLADSKRILAIV